MKKLNKDELLKALRGSSIFYEDEFNQIKSIIEQHFAPPPDDLVEKTMDAITWESNDKYIDWDKTKDKIRTLLSQGLPKGTEEELKHLDELIEKWVGGDIWVFGGVNEFDIDEVLLKSIHRKLGGEG